MAKIKRLEDLSNEEITTEIGRIRRYLDTIDRFGDSDLEILTSYIDKKHMVSKCTYGFLRKDLQYIEVEIPETFYERAQKVLFEKKELYYEIDQKFCPGLMDSTLFNSIERRTYEILFSINTRKNDEADKEFKFSRYYKNWPKDAVFVITRKISEEEYGNIVEGRRKLLEEEYKHRINAIFLEVKKIHKDLISLLQSYENKDEG